MYHDAPAGTLTGMTTIMDLTDQLARLAELRDAGVLSVEEFSAKKAEILTRM